MSLIGLGAATVAAIIVGSRSNRGINKLLVTAMWGAFAAYSFGVRV